jgi:hypothetical protein
LDEWEGIMAQNKIEYEVLEDGTVSRRVGGAISPLIHDEADDLDAALAEVLGGKVTTKSLKGDHSHVHGHAHPHTHIQKKVKL